MKLYFLVIPLITIVTSLGGSFFTSQGLNQWYKTINLPSFTPPGSTIGLVWTTIFVLATVSALMAWGKKLEKQKRKQITTAFLTNAALNITWSFLFFGLHFLFAAFIEAVLLGLSVIWLIIILKPVSKVSSVLLIPYALWVFFASYLTFSVWLLNR